MELLENGKAILELDDDKFILDATAAFRMMWFNKNHPNVVYFDRSSDEDLRKRRYKYNRLCGSNKIANWNPKNKTVQGIWQSLPFPDKSFSLIVWDPPHKKDFSNRSKFNQIYGFLTPETWQYDMKLAFNEFWRVLKLNGVLVFKWGSDEIKIQDILRLFPVKPLFGQVTAGATFEFKSQHIFDYGQKFKNTTYWFCFMKIPKIVSTEQRQQK